MENALNSNGLKVSTGEAATIKSMHDGVTVKSLLLEERKVPELELSFHWPVNLPQEKIGFVLIDYNDGRSFMSAYRYDTFGLDMAYSENSHPYLIKALSSTTKVLIKEISEQEQREYQCELKHVVENNSFMAN